MTIKTSPSLLAADFLNLKDEIIRAETAGADMLHCDVMDGVYVPNISFGFDIIKSISKITSLPLDVHMMTSVPQNYLQVLKDCGASSVTLHSDVLPKKKLIKALQQIKDLGMKSAVSLKPKYPAADIIPFIPYIDMVLIMTVEPGFGGQKFMSDMLPKITAVRRYLNQHGSSASIQVDGGIKSENIGLCAAAGADNFVIGTASFKSEDMKAALHDLVLLAQSNYNAVPSD